MKIATARGANIAGFLACAGLLAYALYSQHVLGLDPCPLCIFQRVAVAVLGVGFALAAVHGGRGILRRLNALLIGLFALVGAGVAGRHVWLQNLPPERVPACGPGLDFMLETLPMREALQMVLSGSGECAAIDWELLGLSMPAWVLITVVVLGAAGFWVNWAVARRPPTLRSSP